MLTSEAYKLLFGRRIVLWTFIAGIYFIVIQPLGPGFEQIPGDLGDTRLNSYALEHFWRWLLGWDESYWTAPYYYPYRFTTAFNENLLGSAPVYASLRLIGFGPYSAFQGWFIVGYIVNYAAAAYVLNKFGFNSSAISAGAFFFTFGLPILAQEIHVQLLYRFTIPFACYSLWRFYKAASLKKLVAVLFWTVWQFYLSIYMGFFLMILIFTMTVILAVISFRSQPFHVLITDWQKKATGLWSSLSIAERIKFAASIVLLSIMFAALMGPYYYISRHYGFERNWAEVGVFFPRPASYLLADHSQWWSFTGNLVGHLVPSIPRHTEHQLFIGLPVLVLITAGMILRFSSKNSHLARVNLMTVLILVIITLNIDGYSLYRILSDLPGIDSIRAVGRIELALTWPIAVYIAWVMNSLEAHFNRTALARFFVFLVLIVLIMESVFYQHVTYSKKDAEARLDQLRRQISVGTITQPVLFVAANNEDSAWMAELDAMLLAQQFGWPTLNGYSGYAPPGYGSAKACRRLPRRIQTYMEVSGITDESFYFDLMNRVVLAGFDDCNPKWWVKMP